MKRISVLATAVSVGLLFALAFASSASASVLCDQSPLKNGWNCPEEHTYQVGDEFHFEGSGMTLRDMFGLPIFSCTWSEVDMTVTNAGAPYYPHPETEITDWVYEGCSENITVLSNGDTMIRPIEAASLNGKIDISNNSFRADTALGNCTFSITGEPELIAESWRTRIKFAKTALASSDCPAVFMYGTYNTYDIIHVFPE